MHYYICPIHNARYKKLKTFFDRFYKFWWNPFYIRIFLVYNELEINCSEMRHLDMSIIEVGELIRSERKKKGITQEELAYELCTTATLSRIENGVHSPNRELLNALLDRIGNIDYQFSYTEKANSVFDYRIEKMKNDIISAYTDHRLDTLKQLLQDWTQYQNTYNSLDEQFVLTYTYLFYYKNNQLELIEESKITLALQETFPTFSAQEDFSFLLTENEKNLLFLLAMVYKHQQKILPCKQILSNLSANFELYGNSYEYVELLYIDTLRELTDICILFEEYTEANTYIDKYIAYCKEHATYSFIPYIRYQKALCSLWANNLDEARENIVKAYYHLLALQRTEDAENLRTKAEQELGIRFKITITRN